MKITAFHRALVTICGAAILLSAAAPAHSATWKCPGNLVQNGGFTSGTVITGDGSMPQSQTNDWTRAYGSPQLQSGAGCHDPYYVSFWGNKAVGEAIQQPVTFVAGHRYAITFCARFHPDSTKNVPYVNIVLRASTSSLTGTACPTGTCETIHTTGNITSQSWGTYTTGCWIPTQSSSYLTISPSNASAANDGAQTSWGQVDDICVREITAPAIEGPPDGCTGPATYCVKPPATGPFTWAVNSGTFQPANADGSCILVTWSSPGFGGAIHATSTVDGCPFTSDLNVPECNHRPCCTDVKAELSSSEIASGGMGLTFNLSGPTTPATTVKATIVSASHVYTTGSCGTGGPITATASSTQPSQAPSGWSQPIAPFLNGNQVVWQSTPPAGSPINGIPFTMNVQLPGTGSPRCNDEVTICIEFEVTFAAAYGVPCRTCTFVQCFKFKRCPLCA